MAFPQVAPRNPMALANVEQKHHKPLRISRSLRHKLLHKSVFGFGVSIGLSVFCGLAPRSLAQAQAQAQAQASTQSQASTQLPVPPKLNNAALEAKKKADWELLHQATHQVEVAPDAPQTLKALSAYQSLLADHPDLDAEVRAMAYALMGEAQAKYGQPEDALATYQRGLAEVQAQDQAAWPLKQRAPTLARVRLIRLQSAALSRLDKPREAQDTIQAAWPLMLQCGRESGKPGVAGFGHFEATAGLSQLLTATQDGAKAQNKTPAEAAQAATAVAARFFSECPPMLDEAVQRTNKTTPPARIYREIINSLRQSQQYEAALSWAKLRLVTCEFDNAAIQRSTQQLAQIWAESDNIAAVKAFTAAQAEASAPNPLQAVPLPPLDKTKLRAALAAPLGQIRNGDPKDWQRATRATHEAVTILVTLGEKADLGLAMSLARKLWTSAVDKPEGAQEICRVFKGADADVARANEFLKFLESPGVNPMTAFFQEYPEQPVK